MTTDELLWKLEVTATCWSREMKPEEILEIRDHIKEMDNRIRSLEGLLEVQDPYVMAAWKGKEDDSVLDCMADVVGL